MGELANIKAEHHNSADKSRRIQTNFVAGFMLSKGEKQDGDGGSNILLPGRAPLPQEPVNGGTITYQEKKRKLESFARSLIFLDDFDVSNNLGVTIKYLQNSRRDSWFFCFMGLTRAVKLLLAVLGSTEVLRKPVLANPAFTVVLLPRGSAGFHR